MTQEQFISIRAPRMGATGLIHCSECGRAIFQFAPPHGGDAAAILRPPGRVISIRAPAWGRLEPGAVGGWLLIFQFAPPHGGDIRQVVAAG